jgi:hypothetical protein
MVSASMSGRREFVVGGVLLLHVLTRMEKVSALGMLTVDLGIEIAYMEGTVFRDEH